MTTDTAYQGGITNVVHIFARSLNILSAIWLVLVALLIVYDVAGREFFQSPFHGTNEIVSNSVLSILFLQLPLSILVRRSLRTTIIYGKVGEIGRKIIDVASYFMALLLFVVIAVGSWENMIEGWAIGEQEGSGIIEIPVYPIRTLVVVVSVIGIVVCGLLIWQVLFQDKKDGENGAGEVPAG